jgi:hypothetical protein
MRPPTAAGRRDGGVEDGDEVRRRRERGLTPSTDDLLRDAAGELLLAVARDDPAELGLVEVGEQVGGGRAARGVHPHVERRVLGVGEAAVLLVELERGDAQVHEHALDRARAVARVLGRDGVDGVVRRVDADEAVAEAGEPLAGEGERLGVAVDPDDRQPGEACERALRVAAHAEGGVDEDGARTVDRRGEEVEATVEKDRQVSLGCGTVVLTCGHRGPPLGSVVRWVGRAGAAGA